MTLVVVVTVRLAVQKYEVDKEIKQLQQKANEINRQNHSMEELAKYLSTPEYTEREAREKLNLKKDGEHVVGLPAPEETANLATSPDSGSNFRKWLDYFFKRRT